MIATFGVPSKADTHSSMTLAGPPPQVALAEDAGVQAREHRHVKVHQRAAEEIGFVRPHAETARLEVRITSSGEVNCET